MANNVSYLIIENREGSLNVRRHPYVEADKALERAADLAEQNPGVTFYVAQIVGKVQTRNVTIPVLTNFSLR